MSKVQNLMSLENRILLQIFIHDLYLLFQISLFTSILTVCFERFPCFLVDSLSAVPYFMIPWILTACFRYFEEDSLPPSDFLEDLLPALPDFPVYLNTHCLLFKISLNVHFLSQIFHISWKTHHLLQMLKVWVRGGQSCCWHIFMDIFVQSPWHLNQFVDAINFLDFSFLVG